MLVETDRTLVQVRQMTGNYAAAQGTVDTKAVYAMQDAHITVIPCPEHKRHPKGWVHKRAPLIKTDTRAVLKAAS
jgi:hypothetical protein